MRRCSLMFILMLMCVMDGWAATKSKPSLMGVILSTISPQSLALVQRRSPPISAVHRAALRHAGLAGHDERRWAERTRWAAALPRLQLGLRQNLGNDVNLRLDDTVSVSGSGVVIGPRASDFTQRSDRNFQLDVRALWNLNELVFSPDSVFVSREARDRRRESNELLREINQLVTQWQALRAWQVAPHDTLPPAMVAQQRAFVQAELDALTGGWFSAQRGEES